MVTSTPVVKAGREVALLVELVNASTGARDGNLTLRADGPEGGFETRVESVPGGRVARAAFPTPGAWNLTLRGDAMAATVRLDVYATSDYHVDATAARYALHYASPESRIPLGFVHDELGTLATQAREARARIERVDENGTVLDSEEKALERGEEEALFVLAHEFGEAGTYLVRLQSEGLGIGYADLPPVKVQVRPGRDPEAPQETPGLPLMLGLAALVLAALATRRR